MIFQVVKLVIPFITVPIVSKALGAGGIGIYSFTSSIAEYFVLLSGVGILLYGNREIAMVRDDHEKLNQTFSELIALKAITMGISLVVYWIVIRMFFGDSLIYYYIHLLTIISVFFDITWFFMGLEEFKKVSLINSFIQIGIFFLLIWKVKQPSDLVFYMFVKAAGDLLGFGLIWLLAFRHIQLRPVSAAAIWGHFKKTMFYFIPQIGVVLYTTLTKTLLGILTTNQNVGVYTNTLHLIVTITTLLTTIDFVLLPRISHLFAHKKMEQIMDILHLSVHVQLFLTIPAAFGIAGVASSIVPWFFGDTFLEMITILPLLSIIVVMMPFGLVLSRQYLLPLGKTKQYTMSVLGGASVSIVLNLLLIPRYGLLGAAIATVAVETVIAAYRVMILLKQTDFVFERKQIISCLVSGFVMYIAVTLYGSQASATIQTTFIQMAIGAGVYVGMCALLQVPYIGMVLAYAKGFIEKRKTRKLLVQSEVKKQWTNERTK